MPVYLKSHVNGNNEFIYWIRNINYPGSKYRKDKQTMNKSALDARRDRAMRATMSKLMWKGWKQGEQ